MRISVRRTPDALRSSPDQTILLGFQVPVPSGEGILRCNALQDLILAAASVDTADTTDASGPDVARAGIPVQLLEHQCCLPAPDADSRQLLPAMEGKRRKYLIEQSFSTYNMIVSGRSPRAYYWSNMTQDVASRVSSCRVCQDQNTGKKWLRCSIDDCRNSCRPVERGLGLTFHKPSSVVRGHRTVKARTVVQQCRQAKVRIRTSLDGAEAQWVEIQEGVVDYVCFYRGATEGITRKMADRLMTTKLFRKDTRECVSVLDLPGSVLLVPRDSLLGEPGPERKVQYRGRCQPELGALLFSSLASPCRELMLGSASCTDGGMKVEQGVYGQRQEMVLSSVELLTLLLEF
ncbi:hypothetical protein F2P81_003399 [Scophthalmus maximus]|uniref:D-aminoacyl-tRNA deacylase n=1 Tax=Scophthalmus maximus TaxID=52904 RepID=A0A6A4TN92_SCOMX|nr:hypothetical protein F2P81_003399 [Scophthalmus maximus]